MVGAEPVLIFGIELHDTVSRPEGGDDADTPGSLDSQKSGESVGVAHGDESTNDPLELVKQKEVVKRVEAMATESQRSASIYQRKLAALDELKKFLLYQAFTGQLPAQSLDEVAA